MKAYYCEEPQTGDVIIKYFETRNQAKDWFANELQMRYVDVKPYRLPWADEYGDKDNIPTEKYFENGWSLECLTCGKRIFEDEDCFKNANGTCCKECFYCG